MRVRADPEDGGPAWDPTPGTPLVPGLLAWRRLAVGHRRETWLCWSVDHWEALLVKLVRPGWTRPRSTAALGREVRALRRVNHPLFPHLVADGTRAELPHLVTDYFNGPALDEMVDDGGPLDAGETANLAVDLLAAVRYLHGTGTAHLDIKPDNVVTFGCQGRLIDLGSSRPLGARLRAGDKVGTDGYVAPELAGWDGAEITPALDLYSIGATLRRALGPRGDPDGAVTRLIERLTAPDPGDRPTPDAALAAFVRLAGTRDTRPWPWWGDRHLERGAAPRAVERARRRPLEPVGGARR